MNWWRLGTAGCGLALSASPVGAQESLALVDAVRLALVSSPVVVASEAREDASEAAVTGARAGYLPRISVSETFQRGNTPVYAFGARLNQGRFTDADFAISRLNDPAPITNYQTQLVVEQTVFDSFETRSALRLARTEHALAKEGDRDARARVIGAVVATYFGLALADETLRVANEAVRTTEADVGRAEAMYDAGMTTEADVLSVRVHLAAVREEQIRARFERDVAAAALNDALGVELDASYMLTTPLTAAVAPVGSLDEYERRAIAHHPERRQAALNVDAAASRTALARSALLPRVVARGVLEGDRQDFAGRGGRHWFATIGVQWSIWNGSANRAALATARHGEAAAEAVRRRVTSTVRLAVRRAFAEVQAATERVAVAVAAVTQAESSHAIIQNRYEAGLAVVTELIRSETALLDARLRHLAALYDQRLARVALDDATGMLTPSSESLR